MNAVKNTPLVSIIIVNWNGGDVMQECLVSLSGISYSNTELIIVDNGSIDGSENLVNKCWFKPYKVIKNSENLGFAPANNQGFKIAKGKYVLLLNNDTKVEKDFLTKLVYKMEISSQVGVLQPKILLMDNPEFLDNAGSFMTRIGFLYHWGFLQKDNKEFSKERQIFSAKGACMLIRKDVIDQLGLFDKDFFSYFEESDFCWRVWLLGYEVLFYPQARIYHKVGFTIRRLDVSKINFHYYKNRVCSLIKNLGVKNIFTVLLFHLIISLGIAVLFFVRLQPKNTLMIARALWWNILHLSDTLEKRKEIQKKRVMSDEQIFNNQLMYPIDWSKYFQDFKRVESDLKRQ